MRYFNWVSGKTVKMVVAIIPNPFLYIFCRERNRNLTAQITSITLILYTSLGDSLYICLFCNIYTSKDMNVQGGQVQLHISCLGIQSTEKKKQSICYKIPKLSHGESVKFSDRIYILYVKRSWFCSKRNMGFLIEK